jgi:hypothetical protein
MNKGATLAGVQTTLSKVEVTLSEVQITLSELMEFMRDNLVTKADLKEEIARALKPYPARQEMYDYFEPWAKMLKDLQEESAMRMRTYGRLEERVNKAGNALIG